MNDKATPITRRSRLTRHLALDENPLRRRTDRLETWIMASLLAAFLAGAPLIAVAAGSWTHAGSIREQRSQRSWHPLPAVLLQAARGSQPSGTGPRQLSGPAHAGSRRAGSPVSARFRRRRAAEQAAGCSSGPIVPDRLATPR